VTLVFNAPRAQRHLSESSPRLLAVVGALLLLQCGSPQRQPDLRQDSLTTRIQDLRLEIPFGVRFAEWTGRPCDFQPVTVAVVRDLRCTDHQLTASQSPALLTSASIVGREIEERPTADALHAGALLEMSQPDTTTASLSRPVAYLDAAVRLGDTSSATLTDLAGALLARAGHSHDAADVVQALNAGARAVAADSHAKAARFDVALALSNLGLIEQANIAWSNYLNLDSTSLWSQTARRYLAAVRSALRAAPNVRHEGVGWADTLARVDAQRARTFGWDSLLAAWAITSLRHDSMAAGRNIRQAEELGRSLIADGDDASLAQATTEIEIGMGDSAATTTLARAHLAYAAGSERYQQGDYAAAEREFAAALGRARGSRALSEWSRLFHGASLIYLGRTRRGLRELHAAMATRDTAEDLALLGRGHWMLGTTLLRSDRVNDAEVQFSLAEHAFARVHERENLGAVQCMLADAEFRIGSPKRYESMQHAMQSLLPYRHSVWLHDLLYTASRGAAADGFTDAALYVQREGVAVASTSSEPMSIVEARLSLARLLLQAGQRLDGQREILRSVRALDSLPPSFARDWLRADLHLTQVAAGVAWTDPGGLDSAVEFFSSHRVELRFVPTLVARAQLRLARRDSTAARDDLRRAASLTYAMAGRVSDDADRAALLAISRPVFDELTKLAIARSHVEEALAYQELGEAYFHPRHASPSAERVSRSKAVQVEFGLLGDSVYAWIDSKHGVEFRRWRLAHDRLQADEEQFVTGVSLRANESTLRVPLGRLYDDLVRPIDGMLPRSGERIEIVENHGLAAVPFAALWDTATNRYLVQDRTVQLVLPRAKGTPPPMRASKRVRTFVVADPLFDTRAYPNLRPLPASRDELRALTRIYPGARTVTAADADRTAVVAGLRWSEIFHFAGHVEYDDGEPEGSRLVLARGGASELSADLTASDIGAMNLHGLRLVVLSSCRALPSMAPEGQGLTGLTSAFLEAGARGVVASGWDLGDAPAARMMTTFHEFYVRSGVAAVALREMQLAMLHATSPDLHSPGTWAAFRYVER